MILSKFKKICSVSVDFAKLFDRVNHDILFETNGERDSKSSTQTIADIFSSSGKVNFPLRMKICRAFNIYTNIST